MEIRRGKQAPTKKRRRKEEEDKEEKEKKEKMGGEMWRRSSLSRTA